MNSKRRYSAARAANVAFAIALAAAAIFIGAGTAYHRAGSGGGWVLIALGGIQLLGAFWVRAWIRRGDTDSDAS